MKVFRTVGCGEMIIHTYEKENVAFPWYRAIQSQFFGMKFLRQKDKNKKSLVVEFCDRLLLRTA